MSAFTFNAIFSRLFSYSKVGLKLRYNKPSIEAITITTLKAACSSLNITPPSLVTTGFPPVLKLQA
jgi:hypothetical protein